VVVASNPEFYIKKLIENWNSKYKGSNLVVLIDIGNQSKVTMNILMNIPKENSVIVMSSETCRSLEHGKAEFIIIVSDVYKSVSYPVCTLFFVDSFYQRE
jgi:hypothetical protein